MRCGGRAPHNGTPRSTPQLEAWRHDPSQLPDGWKDTEDPDERRAMISRAWSRAAEGTEAAVALRVKADTYYEHFLGGLADSALECPVDRCAAPVDATNAQQRY